MTVDTRSHRDSYTSNDAVKTIDLGPVRMTVDSSNAMGGTALVSKHLSNDSKVMRVIADRMVQMVRENILEGTFVPLMPETIERRRYPWSGARGYGQRGAIGGSQPLVASRALVDGIEARSKASGGYAAAQRGMDQWYGFLHDGGLGRLDRRQFMMLSGSQQDEIATIYDDWLMEGMEA